MTDNEIIKALDGADVFLRNRANSEPAPLNEYDIEALIDIANVCDEAANLINRQKAEIERLKASQGCEDMDFCCVPCEDMKRIVEVELDKLSAEKNDVMHYKDQIKAEAVKEVAERLKEIITMSPKNSILIDKWYIDNLVKEMVGEG